LSLSSRRPPDPSPPTTMSPKNIHDNRPFDEGVHLSSQDLFGRCLKRARCDVIAQERASGRPAGVGLDVASIHADRRRSQKAFALGCLIVGDGAQLVSR
jgi:hypothetical protein